MLGKKLFENIWTKIVKFIYFPYGSLVGRGEFSKVANDGYYPLFLLNIWFCIIWTINVPASDIP